MYGIVFFAVIIGVNLAVDPANIVAGVESKIAGFIVQGYNVTNVGNLDERLLQKSIIKTDSSNYETIILGSSRIMLFGSVYYGPNSFNHGVSGATLEDFVALYQIYLENGKTLKKVIIGVDPWIFNKNNGQSRWLSLKKEYQKYHGIDSISLAESIFVYKYAQLLSITYFQESIKKLGKSFLSRVGGITTTYEKLNEELTRLSDGTISYGRSYREMTETVIESKAKEYINGKIYSIEDFAELSVDTKNDFKVFLSRLIQDGISLEIILAPYHPIVYDFIKNNAKYRLVLEVESYIKSLAKESGLELIGSYDPSHFNLDSGDFYDGMHINEKGAAKIMKYQKRKFL